MGDWIFAFICGFIFGCFLFMCIIAVKAVSDNERFGIYADHHCVQQVEYSRDALGGVVQKEVVTCGK